MFYFGFRRVTRIKKFQKRWLRVSYRVHDHKLTQIASQNILNVNEV